MQCKTLFLRVFFGLSVVGIVGWLLFLYKPSQPTKSTLSNQENNQVLRMAPISSPTPVPAPLCATLLFGGDVMLDRNIRIKAEQAGSYDFLMADLESLFDRVDATVVNLEGPVTDRPSRSTGSVPGSTDNFFFTFAPESIESFMRRKIISNLGNNHILNFGQEGLRQTYDNLQSRSLLYFGYVQSAQSQPAYLIEKIGDLKFGLVNFNQFSVGGWEQVLTDINLVRPQVEVLLVYTHWGNEYVSEGDQQRQWARQLVDAGADLVIGSHPHVVQGMEDYRGARIYYSLGNMVFDQYFEEAVQNGLLVEAEVCLGPVTQSASLSQVDRFADSPAESFDREFDEASPSATLQFEDLNLSWQFIEHQIKLNRDGSTVLVK